MLSRLSSGSQEHKSPERDTALCQCSALQLAESVRRAAPVRCAALPQFVLILHRILVGGRQG